MSAEEIINKIDEATLKEEKALPIYTAHISATLFWSGLDKEIQDQIMSDLQILHDDSMRHVRILEQAKKLYLTKVK